MVAREGQAQVLALVHRSGGELERVSDPAGSWKSSEAWGMRGEGGEEGEEAGGMGLPDASVAACPERRLGNDDVPGHLSVQRAWHAGGGNQSTGLGGIVGQPMWPSFSSSCMYGGAQDASTHCCCCWACAKCGRKCVERVLFELEVWPAAREGGQATRSWPAWHMVKDLGCGVSASRENPACRLSLHLR